MTQSIFSSQPLLRMPAVLPIEMVTPPSSPLSQLSGDSISEAACVRPGRGGCLSKWAQRIDWIWMWIIRSLRACVWCPSMRAIFDRILRESNRASQSEESSSSSGCESVEERVSELMSSSELSACGCWPETRVVGADFIDTWRACLQAIGSVPHNLHNGIYGPCRYIYSLLTEGRALVVDPIYYSRVEVGQEEAQRIRNTLLLYASEQSISYTEGAWDDLNGFTGKSEESICHWYLGVVDDPLDSASVPNFSHFGRRLTLGREVVQFWEHPLLAHIQNGLTTVQKQLQGRSAIFLEGVPRHGRIDMTSSSQGSSFEGRTICLIDPPSLLSRVQVLEKPMQSNLFFIARPAAMHSSVNYTKGEWEQLFDAAYLAFKHLQRFPSAALCSSQAVVHTVAWGIGRREEELSFKHLTSSYLIQMVAAHLAGVDLIVHGKSSQGAYLQARQLFSQILTRHVGCTVDQLLEHLVH